jgi:hypothetical protein
VPGLFVPALCDPGLHTLFNGLAIIKNVLVFCAAFNTLGLAGGMVGVVRSLLHLSELSVCFAWIQLNQGHGKY